MRVACVSEGDTEFFCIPKLVGRLGHTIISNVHVGGCCDDWEQTFAQVVLPYVKTAALKNPDKILISVDRESRTECCPNLASQALTVLTEGLQAENLQADIAIVVADRTFEVVLMCDYDLVDRMRILRYPVSSNFGPVLDGTNPRGIIEKALKPGCKYHKVRDGGALASKMRLNDEAVLSRSRSLRKLVKELQPDPVEQ